MKTRNLIIYGTIFIILMCSCYAACPDSPDIIEHRQCLARCEGGLVMEAGCASACTAEFNEKQDNYIKCTEQEEKAAEQTIVQENIGVSNTKGTISIQQEDKTWKEITIGTVLKDGDVIKSDKKSTVSITLADGHILTLAPKSQFTFHEDTNSFSINLMFGQIRAWLKQKGYKFQVRTPTAIMAVRGTDFIVDYDAIKNITTVYLYEGIVDVTNTKGETFELNAGEMITVDSSGKTVKSGLSEDSWNGLVTSIETGEEYVPSQKTSDSEKQKTTTYFIVIAVVVLIVVGALLIKRKRSK